MVDGVSLTPLCDGHKPYAQNRYQTNDLPLVFSSGGDHNKQHNVGSAAFPLKPSGVLPISLFDSLTNKAEELASKQVLSIASSIEAKSVDGSSQIAAIEAAAAKQDLPVNAIKALVGHASGPGDIGNALGGFLKG